jgi:hypothetical protein
MSGTMRSGAEQARGQETKEEAERRRQADRARTASDAAARTGRDDRSGRDRGEGDDRRPDERLERPTLRGHRWEGREDAGSDRRASGEDRTHAPARDRGGTVGADRPGTPPVGERQEMERALRDLLEVMDVEVDEDVLKDQLDAWYRAAPGGHESLTPAQERALEQAHTAALDRAMADVERAARANIGDMHTRTLVEAAEKLDAELYADTTGPLLRGEIARTLLAMHGEFDGRVQAAPLDAHGRPALDGVTWTVGDPLAGITEAIGPFGNIDIWTLASLESPPIRAREAAAGSGERAPLDDAERAERERIAAPSDGVGFAFGADWPDPSEWPRFWKTEGSRLQIALLDPDTMIVVEASASAPGTDAANGALGQRRADNVTALLIAHGIPEDRIFRINHGENLARSAGGRDNAANRVARIRTVGGSIGREALEPDREQPRKRSIPERYRQPDRYTTTRREAERLARSPDEYHDRLKKPWNLPRGARGLAREIVLGVPRALAETGNFMSWLEKMRSDASPDTKLWDTAPPGPLRTLKGSAPFRGVVEYQLKLGGYDPSMYREYLVHWFRRGVR